MHRFTSLFLILGLASTAVADPRGNAREAAADKRELRVDRRETRADVLDLKEVQSLLDRFTAARAKSDVPALTALDTEMVKLARREAREDAVELAKDRAEVRRDRREVRRDRREMRGNAGAGVAVKADDRHDLRDDRRDRRDDRRDAQVEATTLVKRTEIAKRLLALAGKQDPASLDGKQAALTELVALARVEVRQDVSERREDRREQREDRRERREDQRQAK